MIPLVEIRETENDIPKEILELAVDSGTEVHIIPLKFVSRLMRWITGPDVTMHGAGGETIRHYGRVEIVLRVGKETV